MHELNEAELAAVNGGVVAGPNGEGCTDPRQPEEKGGFQLPTFELS
jgi:bacteriocin-like protein